MRNKIIATVLIAILLLTTFIYAEPDVYGPCAILIDAETGRVLYERNADAKMYPASTTKIMTGLLAIENGNLNDVVTVGTNPSTKIERGSSQIYLIPGEQLTLEQLLYALMLESANDAAIAIAEHISGSIESFAELMNKRAKDFGAANTNFLNPNGLHNDNHYTTAKDLALIAFNAMKNETFRKVVSTYSYTIPQTNKQEAREYIRNSNKLIWNYAKNSSYYEYATGIKTGYTVKAKHCLVGGAKKGDTELIAVVLGTEKDRLYSDVTSMLEYGFENYTYKDILTKDQVIATVPISNTDKKMNLLAEEDFSITLSNAELDTLKSATILNENITPPIKKGQPLGSISYAINGEVIKSVNLIASEDFELQIPAPINAIKKHWGNWLLYGILIFFLYRTIVTIIKSKRRKRKKAMYIKR